jgi:hypothetical protein
MSRFVADAIVKNLEMEFLLLVIIALITSKVKNIYPFPN